MQILDACLVASHSNIRFGQYLFTYIVYRSLCGLMYIKDVDIPNLHVKL
jgi:hypothetical protein